MRCCSGYEVVLAWQVRSLEGPVEMVSVCGNRLEGEKLSGGVCGEDGVGSTPVVLHEPGFIHVGVRFIFVGGGGLGWVEWSLFW